MSNDKNKEWLYRDSSKKLLWMLLIAICAASVIAEFFVHRHSHFKVDGTLFFYAMLGFGSCVIMIILAKLLGFFLKAPPDYYDDDSE